MHSLCVFFSLSKAKKFLFQNQLQFNHQNQLYMLHIQPFLPPSQSSMKFIYYEIANLRVFLPQLVGKSRDASTFLIRLCFYDSKFSHKRTEYALVAFATKPIKMISHMHCNDFSWNKKINLLEIRSLNKVISRIITG